MVAAPGAGFDAMGGGRGIRLEGGKDEEGYVEVFAYGRDDW